MTTSDQPRLPVGGWWARAVRGRGKRDGPHPDLPPPAKRLISTPGGLAELDINGSDRSVFVWLTVFGEDGWAVRFDGWSNLEKNEPLEALLVRLSGLDEPEARRVASEFLAGWERHAGREQDVRWHRRFVMGLVGSYLAVAALAAVVTVVATRWRHRRR